MRVLDVFQQHTITYTGGEYTRETFTYRFSEPAKIVHGKKYPLVLFLHGAGERGKDNKKQLLFLPEQFAQGKYRKKYPCFMIVPQCRRGRKWTEVPWDTLKTTPTDRLSDQLKVVMRILNRVLKKYPADPRRVYLTGLSMGGYGSWDLAMRYPTKFAAVAPICGGGDESKAGRLSRLPVWAVHGDADDVVPVERTRRMIRAIRKAGGRPKYSELQGVDHHSWPWAYEHPQGVLPWMFKQKRKSTR